MRSRSFNETLRSDRPVLAEGSVYELLRRDARIRFDPCIAHAGLIYDDAARLLLARVHGAYLDIARESELPLLAFADTWRASAARVASSAFRGRRVNRDNVEFLRDLASASGAGVLVGALTGPRGDAYRPQEAPSADEAMLYHEPQIAELAAARPDVIVAATLPSFEEARGIAALLARSGIDWMLSFVVRPSGVLLDGTPLQKAIEEIDGSVTGPPAGYSINCVHPEIARQALAHVSAPARGRIVLFQGNTSARTPEELDNLPHVDSADPEAFAASVVALMRETSIRVAGGCCGTDETHLRALGRALGSGHAPSP